MKLEFTNLGPIEYGEIDLSKKITAFVGYNSSGKTYASQLIWGVYEILGNNLLTWGYEFFTRDIEALTSDNAYEFILNQDTIDEFKAFINKRLSSIIIEEIFGASDSNLIGKEFSMSIDYEVNFINQKFNQQSSFRMSSARNRTSKESIETELAGPSAATLFIKKEEGSNNVSIFIESINAFSKTDSRPLGLFLPGRSYDEFIKRVKSIAFNRVIRAITPPTLEPFFLPSNRTFFPSYYRYIYEDANERLSRVGDIANANRLNQDGDSIDQIKELSKRRYTKPVSQLIDFLYNLDADDLLSEEEVDDNKNSVLLSHLEGIMGGKIEFERPEGVGLPQFTFRLDEDKRIDLHLASSSTNQLASLYLFLRREIFSPWPSLLIIDEPEENLHPLNQIKLLDVLVRFADMGNYVLFTTHSPLVTNSLNNYFMRRYRIENNLEDLPDSEMPISFFNPNNLRSSDFGVYFFGDGTAVEYKNSKFGAYFSDFSEIESKLKQTTDALRGDIFNL